jgi:hypothetical protein
LGAFSLTPLLQVEVLNDPPDRAAPVFGVGDVGGKPVSQVRHCVGQRMSEGRDESEEGNRRNGYDDGYRQSPSVQVPLQQQHERVEHQRKEAGDHDQEEGVTNDVGQPAEQVHADDDADRRQDRWETYAASGGSQS